MNMLRVFDLFRDPDHVRYLRSTWDAAISMKIDVEERVGSEEWTRSIQDGTRQLEIINGVITEVFQGLPPSDDWPQVRIMKDDGGEIKWVRGYTPPFSVTLAFSPDDDIYQVGKAIQISYVVVTWPRVLTAAPTPPVTLTIFIDVEADSGMGERPA